MHKEEFSNEQVIRILRKTKQEAWHQPEARLGKC